MKVDTHGSKEEEWIGFDLDGTLAKYDGWKGIEHIGEPVDTMVIIAKMLHRIGKKIKVITARVAPRDDGEGGDKAKKYVEAWCKKNLGFVPEITYEKDASMAALFDDRAVAVEQNTGKVLGGWPDFLPKASDKAKKAVLGKTEKKADAHHQDFYRIVKKLKDEYGIDLSHMRMKWSRHPRYVNGKRSYDFADDETVGSHAGDSTIYINPNLRPVMNRFGISGKISDLRRRAIAHELAHEIQATYSEAYNPEFEKKMTDEAKKKGFRTLYTDTVPERKFDKELFAEYMAHLLNKGDSLDVEKKAETRLYTYLPKDNTALTEGILSTVRTKDGWKKYKGRTGKSNKKDVLEVLDSWEPEWTRSKAISTLTNPIPNDAAEDFLEFARNHKLYSFDLKDLAKAKILAHIRLARKGGGTDPVDEVRPMRANWKRKKKHLLFQGVPHYFIGTKDGKIPSEFVREERAQVQGHRRKTSGACTTSCRPTRSYPER